MNPAGSTQDSRRPDWLSKSEEAVNRAGEALLEGVESLAKAVDKLWKSAKRRVSRRRA